MAAMTAILAPTPVRAKRWFRPNGGSGRTPRSPGGSFGLDGLEQGIDVVGGRQVDRAAGAFRPAPRSTGLGAAFEACS
jgi:hypothetical protein